MNFLMCLSPFLTQFKNFDLVNYLMENILQNNFKNIYMYIYVFKEKKKF